ncbi:hypothetical protein [Prevotella sp.]|uniref:hypothetical protein n=1 Tax=uncultured Prevotella sp. TaxID=159272 RepID=UPI00262D9692|nr:hypothetical protein [uncultured Prevotella sp.]
MIYKRAFSGLLSHNESATTNSRGYVWWLQHTDIAAIAITAIANATTAMNIRCFLVV